MSSNINTNTLGFLFEACSGVGTSAIQAVWLNKHKDKKQPLNNFENILNTLFLS
jgi:hypothetical protein